MQWALRNDLTKEIISKHGSYDLAHKAAKRCKACLYENISIIEAGETRGGHREGAGRKSSPDSMVMWYLRIHPDAKTELDKISPHVIRAALWELIDLHKSRPDLTGSTPQK